MGAKALATAQAFKKGQYSQVLDELQTLFAKRQQSAKVSATATLQKTPLKSYLDKTYQRKCGVEVKQVSIGPTVTPALTNVLTAIVGTTFNMGIAQGITDQTRLGNTIETKSLELRLTVDTNVGPPNNVDTLVRIMLVRFANMASGVVPNPNQLLYTTGDIRSFKALDYVQNSTIIKDWKFTLAPPGNHGTSKSITYYHNPKGCEETKWNIADTIGNLANLEKGLYCLYAMAENATGLYPTISFTARFNFVDV